MTLNNVVIDARKRMEKTVAMFLSDIAGLRTGKATSSLLDCIVVDYYGGHVKLSSIANVTVYDKKSLLIKSYDFSSVGAIKDAIENSQLRCNLSVEGSAIRLTLPDLTNEVRKNLVKVLRDFSEKSRVSVRNIRHDAINKLKRMQESKEISEDQLHSVSCEVQKITDDNIKEINKILSEKESAILEI